MTEGEKENVIKKKKLRKKSYEEGQAVRKKLKPYVTGKGSQV